MARTDTLGHFLTDVADAIRGKTGDSGEITASGFDTAISNIPSGADLSDYFTSTIGSGNSAIPGYARIIKKLPPNISLSGKDCSNMFYYARFTELDLSMLNATNITKTNNMFMYCEQLTKIDMRNLEFNNVTSSTNMFGGSGVNTGPPDNCLIIVKDQTQKDWITSRFSRLTNVQTVAEYEASQNE